MPYYLLYQQPVGFSSNICKGRVEKINRSEGIRKLLVKHLKMEESEKPLETIHD